MKSHSKQLAVVLAASFFVGVLLDLFYFAAAFPALSNAVGFKCNIILFGTTLKMPRFGAMPPLLFSLAAMLGFQLVWARRPTKERLISVGRDWLAITVLILLTQVFLIVGGFVYKLSKGMFPDWLKSVVEAFGITSTVYFGKDFEFVTLEGSLAALLGLAVGLLVLYYFGLKRTENP
jgi:hypothetical protein